MKRKLKNNRGETLIEVLASILIGALAVALLFTAVMASISMDRTAKKLDYDVDVYNKALSDAEKHETTINGVYIDGTIVVPADTKVTVKNPDVVDPANIEVNFYGGEGALSYALPTPPAGP